MSFIIFAILAFLALIFLVVLVSFERAPVPSTLVAISIILLILYTIFNVNYSEGDRAGIVTKITKKGFICKTWEGTMNLGGTTTDANNNLTTNTFDFTVKDLKVLQKVKDAMESGKRVSLTYEQKFFTFCSSDSNYFITDVK